MKTQIKSLLLGFVCACLLLLGILVWFLFGTGNTPVMNVQKQILPNGKVIKVTSFYLVWGVEHDERNPKNDSFALEYVSSIPNAAQQARNQEALEVFELIRPVSEQWSFNHASISAFPSIHRKGIYEIFIFQRDFSNRKWNFKRYSAKVHSND